MIFARSDFVNELRTGLIPETTNALSHGNGYGSDNTRTCCDARSSYAAQAESIPLIAARAFSLLPVSKPISYFEPSVRTITRSSCGFIPFFVNTAHRKRFLGIINEYFRILFVHKFQAGRRDSKPALYVRPKRPSFYSCTLKPLF